MHIPFCMYTIVYSSIEKYNTSARLLFPPKNKVILFWWITVYTIFFCADHTHPTMLSAIFSINRANIHSLLIRLIYIIYFYSGSNLFALWRVIHRQASVVGHAQGQRRSRLIDPVGRACTEQFGRTGRQWSTNSSRITGIFIKKTPFKNKF